MPNEMNVRVVEWVVVESDRGDEQGAGHGGPWDKQPQPSAGRLANHLEIHIEKLSTLALKGVQARNYQKNPEAGQAPDLHLKKAA
jgi:hypothetical protein